MKLINKVLAMLISSSFVCSVASAGVIVKHKNDGYIETHIFQNGTYIYQENDIVSLIFDSNNNNCTQISHSTKSYFTGNCKGMALAFKNFMSSKVEESKSAMSSELKASMKKMMEMMPKPDDVKVAVKKRGSTSIQGYESDLYVLMVGDKKISEIWVSKALENDIAKEVDIKKMDKFFKELEETMSGMQQDIFGKKMKDPEQDAEATLVDKGYFMKRIKYGHNEQEVISVEKKKLDLAKYSISKDYQAATSWESFAKSSFEAIN